MKFFLWLVMLSLLSACSSITSRVGEDSQVGKPYVGFEHSQTNAVECSAVAFIGFPPALLVTVPIGILDIMGSAILDTILLPIDLALEGSEKRKQGICHANWSQ